MSAVRDRLFTPEQAAAIDRREGDLLLGANAGSGKTSVLVERFVRSVLEDGLRADQILAITFTEKAAGELRARIRERFVELGRRDDARDAEAAWISTPPLLDFARPRRSLTVQLRTLPNMPFDPTSVLSTALRGWERTYNYERFSLALQGRTPAEKLAGVLPSAAA